MYATTFIFAKKQFGAAFHELKGEIAGRACAIPGYPGKESRKNAATGPGLTVHYRSSLDALRQWARDSSPQEAKAGPAGAPEGAAA